MMGQADDAKRVLIRLHSQKDDETHVFAEQEFRIIKSQIDFESQSHLSLWAMVKRAPLRKRLVIGFLTMFSTQCIGTLIILGQYSSFQRRSGAFC